MKGNPRALAQLIKLYDDAVPEANSNAEDRLSEVDLTETDVAILEEFLRQLNSGREQGV